MFNDQNYLINCHSALWNDYGTRHVSNRSSLAFWCELCASFSIFKPFSVAKQCHAVSWPSSALPACSILPALNTICLALLGYSIYADQGHRNRFHLSCHLPDSADAIGCLLVVYLANSSASYPPGSSQASQQAWAPR